MTGPRPVAAIVYLDVDDEITSAASRIRTAQERRLAIVLPSGSRVSTSRINFRLLAREASTRGRDLSIVAPEAAARALAASAGLPAYASVSEYEAALEDEGPDPPEGDDEPDDHGGTERDAGRAADPPAAGDGATGGVDVTRVERVTRDERVAGAGTGGTAGGSRRSDARAAASTAEGSVGQLPRGGVRSGTAARPGTSDRTGPQSRSGSRAAPAGPRTSITDTVALPTPGVRDEPRRRRFSGFLLALMSLLIVVLGVGSVAGWVLLPAATVTVAARVEPVGPLQFSVRADPLEVSQDVANGIVPAEVVTFDLSVSQEFPATGKKVSETKAGGSLRWTNCDPTRSYTIPAGAIARTAAGQQFATGASVFLPVAILTGNPPAISCQSRDMAVTARNAGTDGNVDAGSITAVPPDYNSVVIRVTNPAATAGGTHTETKVVVQKDVDAAMTALAKGLRDIFAAQLADASRVPPGMTLFPATKSMSSGDPTVDPGSLVGQAVPAFTLGLAATGTATAVDPALVQGMGEQRIRAAVPAGRSLVKGSVDVRLGTPRVDGSAVLYPITARAADVRAPDAVVIRTMVKGLSVDEARVRLRDYGDATVDVWPGWVSSITTYDFRLDVRVVSDVATEPINPEPTTSPMAGPSATPSAGPGST